MNQSQTHTLSRHPTYVVSQDVTLLAKKWGIEQNLATPDAAFMVPLRQKLNETLSEYFAHVLFLSEEEIQHPLQELVDEAKRDDLVTVSLECAYTICDHRLDFTRQVSSLNDTIGGRNTRRGSPEVRFQMEHLRGKNVALVEDVIFSGQTLHDVIAELTHHDVRTQRVIAGVAIAEGKKKVERSTSAVVGMPPQIRTDVVFEFENIIDQICERDFYPGIPYSGREAACPYDYNVPYLLPFAGKQLSEWASIPVKEQKQFSRVCMRNAIAFWEEVERLNGREIICKEIPRLVKGYPQDATRFVDWLHRSLRAI